MAGTLHSREYREIVAALVQARHAAGLSQAALAVRIGRPPSFVAKVELCERRLDAVEFLMWISIVSEDPLSLVGRFLEQLPADLTSR